jgi:YbgC/YbaW family acyl-CoA thioester hydrolase
MTGFVTVDCTVYPYECDAFGHLNQAAVLALLERARWEALARGPGIDIFHRNGVWPAVRRATIEYRAAAYPGDVLRVETLVTDRGTTSFTLRQLATRIADQTLVSDAELVFVCIDRVGRPAQIPEEIGRLLGPRGGRGASELRVESGGATLAVEVRAAAPGGGPPVLFVHGFPFDRTMWKHQLAALGGGRCQRVAVDLRGAGASSVPASPDEYDMARYADDLVAVLDAVGASRAVICGLSMGGYIAFELLRRHPERVRALVLCDTKAEADSAEGKRGRDEMAALAERDGAAAVAARLLPKLLAPATLAAQPEVVEHVRAMIERTPVAGIVGALRAMRDRRDATDLLPHIAVPTLVLGGEDDTIAPPRGMAAMAAAIPGAQYASIPAAAHLAPLEQPLATGRVLADFLHTLAPE